MFRFSVTRTWLVGVLLLVAAGVRPAAAATVYLGPNEANRTLQQAFAAMRGGDTLIIRDGVYAERFINPPSGTAGAYTTIKAEHVGGVLFDGAGLADWSSTLTLYNVSYLQIEGLHFKANPDNPTVIVAAVSGGAHHIKLLRCAFYDAAKTENNSVVNIGPAATDVLLEECWAWGYGRYKFLIYQAQRVVVRRSVARHDYHTPYPDFGRQCATFTMYDSTDVLFENNIVVDSGLSDGSNGTFWGGIWSENNSAVDNRGRYLGNIFLNLEGLAAINDPKLNTGARVITNNVIWDAEGGYDGDVQGGSPTLTIDHSTFGNIWGTYSRDSSQAWGTAASYGWTAALTGALTKNSLIYDMHSYGVTAWMRSDYNNFYGNGTNYAAGVYGIPAPTPGAHDRYADPGQKYITRIEAESPLKGAASDGGDIGANVLYRYGVSGTLWGEAGYDQLTTEALWPFPNEALIKADMASYGGPGPAGTRGFCANGQTLTNYIWGYLGHSVPPFGLLATPGDRSVTLSWYRPADLALATTTGFNIYRVIAGQHALVGTVAGNATYMATVTGLTPAEPYVFAVTAVDAQKGESGFSDPAMATPSTGSGSPTTPTITWPTPAAIVQGTALCATQLNATASVAGAFVYTPAAGTVPSAGTQTLAVTFTPTNTTLYTTAGASRSLVVTAPRTTPTITWATPAAIVQGTALSATQLNATASVAGTFVYTPAAGTVPSAGTQTLAVTFTPTNTTLYTSATASRSLVVTAPRTTPTITWPTPAAIVQGTALSATQLNATASVAGAFVYTPAAGTVLAAGTWTLTATFTPTNITLYTTASASRSLVVTAATGRTTPTITWPAPASIVQGTALSATQLNATASVAGAFVYTPPAGTVLAVGTQTLAVTFTPTNTTLYTTASASRTLVVTAATTAVRLLEDLLGRQVFPVDNWWNLDISQAPVDPQSAAFITFLGATRGLHPDFGPPPYGIPYVTVGASQPRVPVTFTLYGDESDAGAPGDPPGYPVPTEARTLPNYIEGGVAGGGTAGDRHMLIVDRDRGLLYELGGTVWNTSANRWDAAAGAVFDLASNARRPDGWTSVDAAGLAVLPGLVRYDEAYGSGEIRHALRFTSHATNGYVWPASHRAGSTTGAPPLGTRLRLKASVDLSGFAPPQRRIFQAMKTYGLILADNGSDLYISGTMDGRWNNDDLNPAFSQLKGGDFEIVQLGWRPTATPTTPTITWATPASIVQGTALSATQLNATASVAGAFVYTPAAGTVLAAGTWTLTATFTPTNTTLYTTASASRSLVVTAAAGSPPNGPPYRLTVTRPTGGMVNAAGLACGTTATTCQVTMPAATALGVQATPDVGYGFAGWTGDCLGTAPSYLLQLAGPRTCGALFVLVGDGAPTDPGTSPPSTGGTTPTGPPYTLTISRPTGGLVRSAGIRCGTTKANCQVTTPAAMSLRLEAAPDTGYTFLGWTGDCVGTSPGFALALNGSRTCGAVFTPMASGVQR